jgi:hypothetical protein
MNIQTFITIGAIVLLGVLGITLNRIMANAEETKIYSESILTANSLAQEVINEVKSKKFDKNIGDEITVNVANLTPTAQFGAAQGKPVSEFTSVEEYHNHKRTVKAKRLGDFNIVVTVSYVKDNDFTQTSQSQTRTKEILVKVSNNYLLDTLRLRMYKSF